MKHLFNIAVAVAGIAFAISQVNNPLVFVLTFLSVVFFIGYILVVFAMDITK